MPAANTRITITPTSEAHSILLSNWAMLEGRTLSNLCSSLLENAINEAISKGTVNPQALEMMNEFINVRRNNLKFEYGKTLTQEEEKAENYLNTISEQASGDPEDESKFNAWTSRAEEVWNKYDGGSNPSLNTSELYKYEPDLDLIMNYIEGWDLYYKDVPEATKLLTRASMAGCDLAEINRAISKLFKQENYSSEMVVETLNNICNAMIQSQKLSLSKEIPF